MLVCALLTVAQTLRSCASCDAGYQCGGYCLTLVAASDCPTGRRFGGSGLELHPTCDLTDSGATNHGVMDIGEMCEGDGECGTNDDADNCPSSWSSRGGHDVYRREACIVTTPQNPPPPPEQPVPGCGTLQCDAGQSCGICLVALKNDDAQCPQGWESDWKLNTCDKAEPGEYCEADGECACTASKPAVSPRW